MDTNNFTSQEINQYRAIMGIFGKLYGRRVICPLSDNVDLGHKEAEKNDINPRFAKPIKKYYTKTVDLLKFALSKNANGKAVIIINDDPVLTFPLVPGSKPQILECTQEKVNEAIRKYEIDGTFAFFTDIDKVVEVVTTLNEQNMNDLQEFADKCLNHVSALQAINKTEKAAMEEYYKSINA